MKQLLTLLCGGLLLGTLAGCGRQAQPQVTSLGEDYRYLKYNDALVVIFRGEPDSAHAEVIVPATVDEIAVENGVAFGHVTPLDEEVADTDGSYYFYIVPETGEVVLNLSKAEWTRDLGDRGIRHPYVLLQPELTMAPMNAPAIP